MDDDLLLRTQVGPNLSLCISSLPRKLFQECAADSFESDRGFFVYEQDESQNGGGIAVLGKLASLEAAYRFFDLILGIKQNAANSQPTRG